MTDRREHEPDARFALANERTFLAWGRTCLALVTAGLLLAKGFGLDEEVPAGFGIVLIAIGAILGVLSYRTYLRNDQAIRSGGKITRSALPTALLLTILAISAVAVVLSL